MSSILKGSCHCGAIHFEMKGNPIWVGRCHCLDCRKISGSAFMAYAEYMVIDVTFTRGTPKLYKSSPNVTRTFCSNCGSPIEWRRNDISDRTSLTLGLLEKDPAFNDIEDIHNEESLSWLQ